MGSVADHKMITNKLKFGHWTHNSNNDDDNETNALLLSFLANSFINLTESPNKKGVNS